jgi:protein-disulfide isomerase
MQQRAHGAQAAVPKNRGFPTLIFLMFIVALGAAVAAGWVLLFDGGPPTYDPLVTETTHTKGSSHAPVSMVVFADFQCANCAIFTREVRPRLQAEFVDEDIVRLALGVRLDPDEYRACMRGGTTSAIIEEDLRRGTALGFSGSHGVYVDGLLVPDPTDYPGLPLHVIAAAMGR